VRPGLGHGLAGVGGGQDPAGHRDRRPRQAPVVAGPVEALAGHRRDRADPGKGQWPGQGPFGVGGEKAYPLLLGAGQGPGLAEDRGGDAVQPDVVDQRGAPHGHDLGIGEAAQPGGGGSQLGHPSGVARPWRGPQIGEVGHRLKCRAELTFGQPVLQAWLGLDQHSQFGDGIGAGEDLVRCRAEHVHHGRVELLAPPGPGHLDGSISPAGRRRVRHRAGCGRRCGTGPTRRTWRAAASGRRSGGSRGSSSWPRRMHPPSRAGRNMWGAARAMTRQYLIGELSVRLERLQATTGRAAPGLARLRAQVETGPLAGLASATAQVMALADELCWDSLSRGDAAAFAARAMILAELRQFGVSARLLGDR